MVRPLYTPPIWPLLYNPPYIAPYWYTKADIVLPMYRHRLYKALRVPPLYRPPL